MTDQPRQTSQSRETSPARRPVPESWGERRERTVEWYDPLATAAAGLAIPGLDYLRAIRDGVLPPAPISGLVNMGFTEVEPGRVVFTCRPDESGYNPLGGVHGGVMCTLLDSVCGCALHSTLPLGKGYTSVEIKVSFLKGVTTRNGLLSAVGTVVKAGSRVGFTEGVITDESGAVVATATSTLLVFDLPPT